MNDSQSLPSVFSPGNVAVVTGAASGIGLAAARCFATLGMKLVMVDLGGTALDQAAEEIASLAASDVIAAAADVADREQLARLQVEVVSNFGPVALLMNNAGVGNNPGLPWEHGDAWKTLVDVNLWGVVNGVQAFVPGMLASDKPGMVINTGSKQGITSPPGNAAYNMSKAALKSGLRNKLGVDKQFVAVEHTRDIGKKNMIHNDATPDIEVDPETYEVRADGELLTCAPAEVLPMAQRYFLF